MTEWRTPDAAQRHQRVYARLRRAMACAADPGSMLMQGKVVGPGSAEQREERCTASGTRDEIRKRPPVISVAFSLFEKPIVSFMLQCT